MILTITPNPALDVTYALDSLELGASHRVRQPVTKAGGKGINVASVAHAQGSEVHVITTGGGAAGDLLASDLTTRGLPATITQLSAETRRSTAIVTSNGEATLLNEIGRSLTPDELQALAVSVREHAGQARVVVLSGSLPPSQETDIVATLLDAAGDVPTIVDTSGSGLLAAAEAGATLLKPNQAELAAATGISDPELGARHLLERGAQFVVVSLGAEGMFIVQANTDAVLHARIATPLIGNPTGAGDAAVAAIAQVVDREGAPTPEHLPDMLRRAVAWSAAAVLCPQAGDISPRHRELLGIVKIVHR